MTSPTSGKLRFAVAELACLPRGAVVVEDRCSRIFALTRVRPALIADGLAELQVRRPNVPIVFRETRKPRGMGVPVPGRRPGLGHRPG